MREITRRHWLRLSALGAAAVPLAACRAAETICHHCGENDDPGTIANNHGHCVCLTAQQEAAQQPVILTLTLAHGHEHRLSLNGDQVAAAGNGEPVLVTSTVTEGHSHDVTFNPVKAG